MTGQSMRAIRPAVLKKSNSKEKRCLVFEGQIIEVEEAQLLIFFDKIIAK